MVTVVAGGWPRLEGNIAPRSIHICQWENLDFVLIYFSWYFFPQWFCNSGTLPPWLWSHLTGNFLDCWHNCEYYNLILFLTGHNFCSSFWDMWILFYCTPGVVVMRAEDRDRLIFGPITRWFSLGFVKKTNSNGSLSPGSCRQSSLIGPTLSLGARLSRRWEGGQLNQAGQGEVNLLRWGGVLLLVVMRTVFVGSPLGFSVQMIKTMTYPTQDFSLPRSNHNWRHCPHLLQVIFHQSTIAFVWLLIRRAGAFIPGRFVQPVGHQPNSPSLNRSSATL